MVNAVRGMKMPARPMGKGMGIEIEVGPEGEGAPEGEGEEATAIDLSSLSDEELMEEVKMRGLLD